MGKKANSREMRRDIIAFLNKGIKSNSKIAELVGVSEKYARTTTEIFILPGENPEKPTSGRPLVTTTHDNRVILRDVRNP